MQFGAKALIDKRTGGEVNYDPSKDKLTTNYYGLGITTSRFEEFAKIGYVFPQKNIKASGCSCHHFSTNGVLTWVDHLQCKTK